VDLAVSRLPGVPADQHVEFPGGAKPTACKHSGEQFLQPKKQSLQLARSLPRYGHLYRNTEQKGALTAAIAFVAIKSYYFSLQKSFCPSPYTTAVVYGDHAIMSNEHTQPCSKKI